MSYSAQVKAEIIRNFEPTRPEFMALLAAVMKVCGTLSLLPGQGVGFRISTENAATARLLTKYFKQYVDQRVNVVAVRGSTFKKNNLYVLKLDDIADLKGLLLDTGILALEGENLVISDQIARRFTQAEGPMRAYLKGAFLGSGSIAHPEKQYHLEFVTHSENYAKELVRLLARYDLRGRIIARKGSQVVYFKEGEQIVDLLNLMGAHQALFETENIRIVKDMRNNVNRLVNCETANLSKTVNASVRQMEAIRAIERTIGLSRLPELLQEVAEARLHHPDLTLAELGELLDPPVGKSGINHRLRKIEKIASELEKEGR
ncbi:Cytoplasmic hypothetical protein [Clostridiaceae bacterium JG1575]|nr:Cytoplasmic hypothetical protein [Clostridiaceae bacterium JG1575]